MNRRNFLRNSAAASIALPALGLTACNNPGPAPAPEQVDPAAELFPLDELTVEELQEKMAAGVYTAAAITQLYLNRIAYLDKAGPRLNAVIELNPEALDIAKAMDDERRAGKLRGPLHGIPVLIKDNIDTADQMQTTAGSLALEGHRAQKDAFIVSRLRAAGAVLLGKTNLSEWANFRSTHSCSGWSSRGGQSKNPYILDHNPCGSSAGSGVAVAANLCAVAVGTETDGSITCPASVNNIIGIKPTVGLLSRAGIIPISHTQDTPGPMARTVKDAAILLGVLAGEDPEDPVTRSGNAKLTIDYSKFLEADGLKGKRIGVDRSRKSKNQYLEKLLDESLLLLQQQGATIIEVTYRDAIDQLGAAEFEVLQFEFKDGLNKYLARAGHSITSLAALIRFNQENADKVMPYFKQELLEACEQKTGIDNKAYQTALGKSSVSSRQLLSGLINRHQLDAISGITMGPACSIDVVYGDRWGDDFLTAPAAMSGFPHISVPAGWVYNLPVGLSFFGLPYTEGTLISMAYAFEQVSKKRVAPGFTSSFLP